MTTQTLTEAACYHCGTEMAKPAFVLDDKPFCCIGCQSVYQVLTKNNLCSYYDYNDTPGQLQAGKANYYEYLDEPAIVSKLVDYEDENITAVTFYIPAIHCSSCIWLLEHLYKIDPAVITSRIDFLKKELSVTFRHGELSFRRLVELLVSVGYEPSISLQDVVKQKKSTVNHELVKRIAVAGFCMGNVMMLSFPEYFGLSDFEKEFKTLFGYLNLAFSIPVTFYCGREFFVSAWSGLRNKMINLDAPLALIIAVLFLRSTFEIVSGTGPGFNDTLTGLVFLLLMGRWVKLRTYNHLSFDRDYRSYFPVAVTVLRKGKYRSIPIEEITIGDHLFIRNNEIIPADARMLKGEGMLDFSFVTGESALVKKLVGANVYAGGRQMGGAIELEVIKPVSQSYLTGLWNNKVFKQPEDKLQNFNDNIAKYFSTVTLLIAFSAAGFWALNGDSGKAWSAFTAVLIVACPCVLSLSTPFTLSAVLGIFDKNRFYLKNTQVVEQLASIDTMVFDKTGTITIGNVRVAFSAALTDERKVLVASLASNSSHPLSREIVEWLGVTEYLEVTRFFEVAGTGIYGEVAGHWLKLGKSEFIRSTGNAPFDATLVQLDIDDQYAGHFTLKHEWRQGLGELFESLHQYDLHVLSGDDNADKERLSAFFPSPTQLHFRKSPQEKLDYIEHLQGLGRRVMMIGDGLNDAGALKQSDLGVAVTDNINNFNPGCDAILEGRSLMKLKQFINQAKGAVSTVKASFAIATCYNLLGIYFAVQGKLAPLTAAVLMPLSTITIILFTSVLTKYFARKNHLIATK